MDSSDTQPLHQAAPKELLKLEGGVSLAFEGDNLIVKDKSQAKKNRRKFCGFHVGSGRPELTIPFYNVLWAEVTKEGDGPPLLVIDYAHAKNHQVQPRRLAYPVVLENNNDQIKNISDNSNDNNGNNDYLSATSTASENAQAWAEALLSRAYGPGQQRRRRARVIVNPHAGPGGAGRIWEREVRPLFEAARLVIDATYTAQAGEAVGICEHLDVGAYDVVVPCSGDGLPHEVFNGLGRRRDARSALRRLAVAHIPCGSGNAMSCNLNGSHRPGEAALAVIKGVRTPMDLMSITQGGGHSNNRGIGVAAATEVEGQAQAENNEEEEPVRRTLSFLSQSVGLIAECDLGTESMRWMGPARFNVGVAQRIFSKKVYPCDVAVKVEVPNNKDRVKARYRREKAEADHNVRKEGRSRSGAAADESDDLVEDGDEEGLPTLRYGTIGDEIPDDWEKLTFNHMGNFYCGNMPYMAPDANFFPATTPNDGLMDLVVNDGSIPPFKYLQLMTAIEKEKFFENPLVSYWKVSAYRITPRDQKDGYISIDGERIPFEPFQVEIHQGLATVLSKNGKYEANGPPGWENAPIDENAAA